MVTIPRPSEWRPFPLFKGPAVRRRLSAAPCWALLLACGSPFAGAAPPTIPVEGDADLLRAVRDGLVQSESAYGAGTFSFRLVDGSWTADDDGAVDDSVDEYVDAEVAEGRITWTPDGASWDVKRAKFRRTPERTVRAGNEPADSFERLVAVTDGKQVVQYFPGRERARVHPLSHPVAARSVVGRSLFLRPADIWFMRPSGREWSSLLDPDRPADGPVETFVVRQEGPVVTAERRHKSGRRPMTVIVSLDGTPRVLGYEIEVEGGAGPIRGIFDWKRTAAGDWYPATYVSARPSDQDGGTRRYGRIVRIEEIEIYPPGGGPPAETFRRSAVEMADGTRVTLHNLQGRPVGEEQVGGPRTAEDRLDDLAETLKAGRFAGGADEGESE